MAAAGFVRRFVTRREILACNAWITIGLRNPYKRRQSVRWAYSQCKKDGPLSELLIKVKITIYINSLPIIRLLS